MRQVRIPRVHRGTSLPPPEDVGVHPGGASPFGVQDLVGHVWQFTDEFRDEHTRSVLLRGGSNYVPADDAGWSSRWYFPQAKKLDQHNKYFLMDGAYERAGTLGFRCVQDAAPEGNASAQTCWEGSNGPKSCVRDTRV